MSAPLRLQPPAIPFLALALALAWGVAPLAAQPRLPFAPPEPIEEDATFSFVAYGDIQGNYQGGHDALVRQMELEPEVRLILSSGDVSPDHGEDYDRHFYPAMRDFAGKTPFFPSPGNHDVDFGDPRESRTGFKSFFSELFDHLAEEGSNPHLTQEPNQRTWYHFVYGGVLYIALDSNLFIDEGKYRKAHAIEPFASYRSEQLRWVRDVLDRYGPDPSIRAIFVAFHHSPFVTYEAPGFLIFGGHPGHSEAVVNLRVPGEGGEPGEFLLDLFRRARVTAVFSGHEHYYERWVETLSQAGTPYHSLHWVLTGQGGVKPRGRAEYDDAKVERLVDTNEAYRAHVERWRELAPNASSELLHAYPRDAESSSRFPSYVLVTVGTEVIRFATKDTDGVARDSWTTPTRHVAKSSAVK